MSGREASQQIDVDVRAIQKFEESTGHMKLKLATLLMVVTVLAALVVPLFSASPSSAESGVSSDGSAWSAMSSGTANTLRGV